MKLRAASALAWQKLAHRKARSIITAVTLSLGITIMLALVFASNGFLKTVRELFPDTAAGRYFAAEALSAEDQGEFDLAVYKEGLMSYSFVSLSTQTILGAGSFGLENILKPKDFSQLRTIDEIFVRDFLAPGQRFSTEQNGTIPVLVPRSTLLTQLDPNAERLSQKDQYDLTKRAVNEYVGKTYPLLVSRDPEKKTSDSTEITLRIAGLTAPSLFSSRDLTLIGQSLLVPPQALAQGEPLQKLISDTDQITPIIEFTSAEERDRFVKDRTYNPLSEGFDASQIFTGAQPLDSRYEMLSELGGIVRKIGLGVGGFFVALAGLFIMLTLGKVVSDSRREIAVYRAVGAKRADIKLIVSAYAVLLLLLGFIFGLLVAVGVTFMASSLWGEQLFYFLVNLGTSSTIEVPKQIFVGLAWGPILALLGAALVVGLLAALLPAQRAARIDPVRVLKDE
ncbi:MAG: ABC transporter permease [Parcubacteria group bacterium]